jgi:hypothetical protein|tara:strand:+ start:3477 stop:4331 length:855 start_codon:yes stop_codon:yes gene_type:complete
MNHPAELAINQYLEDATSGKSTISEETIAQIGKDVMDAVRRQFGGGKGRDEFRLRMSNIGKPTCQLWFAKNKPEKALPKPTTFVMNMLLGDIVEAAFKGIITEAGVAYDDKDNFVELELKEDTIKGSYDLIMDGALDDVKSASDWSYRNKFESYETLSKSDPFGYVGQLAGYAKATGKKVGGWWVVNKANGNIKYVPASGLDLDVELDKIQKTVDTVNKNEFERCFHPVPETFRGKPSGHKILNDNCKFCDFRFECYPEMQELPSKVSQARVKPIVSYIEINEG